MDNNLVAFITLFAVFSILLVVINESSKPRKVVHKHPVVQKEIDILPIFPHHHEHPHPHPPSPHHHHPPHHHPPHHHHHHEHLL